MSRRAGPLSGAVPIHSGRRVSGHQLCAVYDHPPAVADPFEGLRRGRRRAVDLFVSRGQDREHPLVQEGLSLGDGLQAGAELPFDADDRRRGQLGDRPQLEAHGEALFLGGRRGRQNPHPEGIHRPRGGRNGRYGPARQGPRGGRRVVGGCDSLPHQQPVGRAGGQPPPPGHSLPHLQGFVVLRPQGDPRHDGLYPAGDQSPRRRGLQAHRQLSGPRHRRHDRAAYRGIGRRAGRLDVGGGRRAGRRTRHGPRAAHHRPQGGGFRGDDPRAVAGAQRQGAVRFRTGDRLAVGHHRCLPHGEHPRGRFGAGQHRGAAELDAGVQGAGRRRNPGRRASRRGGGHHRGVVAEHDADDRHGSGRPRQQEQGDADDGPFGQGA